MATVTVDNNFIWLEDFDRNLIRRVNDSTSYLVKGCYHATSFKNGWWDGRKRLITLVRRGLVKAPLGLAEEILRILETQKIEYKLVDNRRKVTPYVNYTFDFEQLRPYQKQAVDAATNEFGILRSVGCGIIKSPPRSGKTRIAAGIISRLGVKTLFVVPSKSLLYQSQSALKSVLNCKIGIVGDNLYQPQDITVATIQTLSQWRRKATKAEPSTPEYKELISNCDCVIVDELHHLEGDEWRKVIQDSEAPYKIGLSATVFLDHSKECELGVIWLKACTGEILVDYSVSDLIEAGFLVKPEIRLYPINTPDLQGRGWSAEVRKQAMLKNEVRNKKIVSIADDLINKEKMKVVIISNRLEQVKEICDLLLKNGIKFARVVGNTKQDQREHSVKRFVSGNIDVLIGTVFGEGVDIPEIDAVINAEGGAGIKATYQRLRCLTPHNGKERAVVIDFIDLTHSSFAQHSIDRINVYKSERAFKVIVQK